MNKLFFFFILFLGSCLIACDDIFVKDISDHSIHIIAPADEAVLTGAEVTLVWDVLEGADDYHVIVVSPTFDNILSYVCDSITEDYKLKMTLAPGVYEWSVQARNSAYLSLRSIGTFEIANP